MRVPNPFRVLRESLAPHQPSGPLVPEPALDTIIINEFQLLLPRHLRPLVGAGSPGGNYFEAPAMWGMLATVSPGDTVYDVGMSFGVFTCILATLVGQRGQVHSFEANPQVLPSAREFIAANGLIPRISLTLGCVSDTPGRLTKFHVVPGTGSVASTQNRDICMFCPDAWELLIPTVSLDSYWAQHPKPPACIKIDVEGSEYQVLRGAEQLLLTHHPYLVVETHGDEIDGIGGSVQQVCAVLNGLGYDLFDLDKCVPAAPKEYATQYARRIGYLLAAPAPLDDKLALRLRELKERDESFAVSG